MRNRIHFVFVGEGSSDESLVSHLERLCVLCGADEAAGVAPDWNRLRQPIGRTVAEKVQHALQLEPDANLLFVHRDADAQPRYIEISEQIKQLGLEQAYVAVIPVQEIEAWLLLEEAEIRRVAENPKGTVPINLPPFPRIEKTPNPKEVLFQALVTASGTQGRRLRLFKKSLSKRRRLLLERLQIDGRVCGLNAWKRMHADTCAAVASLSKEVFEP